MGIDLRKDKKDDTYCFILNNNVEILLTSDVKFLFDRFNWQRLSFNAIVEYFDKFSAIGIFKDDVLQTFIPKQSIIMFTKIVERDFDFDDDEQ